MCKCNGPVLDLPLLELKIPRSEQIAHTLLLSIIWGLEVSYMICHVFNTVIG